jgi:hypothetical protein
VPVTQEEGQEIEGEFMLTGGHVSQWYESWSKGREKAIAEARDRALKKVRAEQLAQLAWGAAPAGRPNRAPASGRPEERPVASPMGESPMNPSDADAFAAKLARNRKILAANRRRPKAGPETSQSNGGTADHITSRAKL